MKSSTVIVHVSDVHFARELYPNSGAQGGPMVPNPAGSVVAGLRPHDVGACRDLANAVDQLLRHAAPTHRLLAVSGDLTRKGSDSEFSMATSYLCHEVAQTRAMTLGLAGRFDRVVAVPGNHDHWRNSNWHSVAQPGPNPAIHGAWFEGATWLHTIECAPLQIQVMGLDSCGRQGARLAATGCIALQDLSDLRAKVRSADQVARSRGLKPVRALLVHHPLWSVPPGHGLDQNSIDALKQFFRDAGVHAYLTGHTHASSLPTTAATPWEMRCGTTLQSGPPGGAPSKEGQVFLSHRIYFDNGLKQASWEVTKHQRVPGRTGFVPISRQGFVVP